ncbi:MAG TPA: nucleotidyltransferase family protein [Acidiphilium sp.]|nr:nucleotidyltransferase family protein [Acidiphilium sp.]
MIPREAIILSGGFGTRLRAAVRDVPKPLAPVAGRPFLAWLLDSLARQGLEKVVLSTGYLGSLVRATLGPSHGDMALEYVQEQTPLGTGGALWMALGRIEGERVFVLNGDTWFSAPLGPLADEAPNSDLTLAVRPVRDRARYGAVYVRGNKVLGLEEKGQSGPGLVNAGLYVLRRDLGMRFPMHGSFSLESEVLARPEQFVLRAHACDVPFLDIGTPEDFARAQSLIPEWSKCT